MGRLAALILLCTVSLTETAEAPYQISFAVAEVGGKVTFQCPVSETESRYFYWYKQSLGYMVQTVAKKILGQITVSEEFKHLKRFTVTKEDTGKYFLTITNVSKDDEAQYLCQNAATYGRTFVNGTFLAVNDPKNQQKQVNVEQSPQSASVQPGGSVTLQCSFLSSVQCLREHSVYWFRAGSGGSHPAVIYTHRNRTDGRSCVYSLSRTIRDSSDAGTYHCAVVTCGHILFGEGTKVDTRKYPVSDLDSVVLALGVLLFCCVTAIVVLVFCVIRRKVCEHCRGPMSVSHHLRHNKSTVDKSNDLDDEAKTVNYAALDFSTREVKRGKNKKRESPRESLYSVVKADYRNQLL